MSAPFCIWDPQPRQEAFITCPADDTGFGGARGGGKSDGVVGDFIDHEETYAEHAIGMAFRRERTQLMELVERAKQIMLPIGYKWHEQDKYFRGPKGGRLRFTYLENDSDADAYQGHSYSRLYPEEMGTFPTESPINKLQATLRSGQGVPCQMKGTMNPGGPGHHWVKARYRLDEYPQGFRMFETEYENPFTKKRIIKTRMFIPSKLSDNKYLGDDYVAQLAQVGSKSLVRAWLEGDWNVIEGAFFDGWSEPRHVVIPCEIPASWKRFRALDWGYAKPFSVGWYAISDGELAQFPRGALVKYREWYGKREPNVGIRIDAEDLAQGVLERERDDPPPVNGERRKGFADPSIFAEDGGPSIAERMHKVGCAWYPADNKRIPGWDQLRARLGGEDDMGNGERPMIYFFSTCRDSIRTIPALQHDDKKAEDVDTDGEDHAADETRYACMSRPWLKTVKPPKPVMGVIVGSGTTLTINEMWKQHDRQRASRGRRI